MTQQTVSERAKAKINLTLHVGAPRADGYHPLESLVVFADISDGLTVSRAARSSLSIDGPFAAGLSAGSDNLILRAAEAMGLPAQFHLTKNLPVASGIGGGSADAAAAMRGLLRLYGSDGFSQKDINALAFSLGADVPVCLNSAPAMMSGIGEHVDAYTYAPRLHAVLVNPNRAVSTAAIFKAFDRSLDASSQTRGLTHDLPSSFDEARLKAAIIKGRNDLAVSAIALEPEIADVLDALGAQNGIYLARMSGSGATCFGLFETGSAARAASAAISAKRPTWWCTATEFDGAVL